MSPDLFSLCSFVLESGQPFCPRCNLEARASSDVAVCGWWKNCWCLTFVLSIFVRVPTELAWIWNIRQVDELDEPIIDSFIHSFRHSFLPSFFYCIFFHSFILFFHSCILLFFSIHSFFYFFHSFIHSFISFHSFIHPSTPLHSTPFRSVPFHSIPFHSIHSFFSFIHSFIQSVIHSIHSFIPSIHSFFQSFSHFFMHSFSHCIFPLLQVSSLLSSSKTIPITLSLAIVTSYVRNFHPSACRALSGMNWYVSMAALYSSIQSIFIWCVNDSMVLSAAGQLAQPLVPAAKDAPLVYIQWCMHSGTSQTPWVVSFYFFQGYVSRHATSVQ